MASALLVPSPTNGTVTILRHMHARFLFPLALLVALMGRPAAQDRVTTPKEHLGFSFGDDYQLANYTQIAEYGGSWMPNRTG